MLFRSTVFVLALGCLIAVSVHATVLVPAEFREIVNGSEIIAFGRVIDATAEMTDDRSRVETIVTLEVGTYLKGGPGETLVFKVPGGQIGRYRDVMVGAPIFEAGDEAVVFLRVRGSDRPTIFGLNQGLFRVRVDEKTKRRIVVSPAVMASGEVPEPIIRGSPARQSVLLETFGVQVRTVMAEAAQRSVR